MRRHVYGPSALVAIGVALITDFAGSPVSEAATSEAPPVCALNIESLPLDQSLQELARQCGVQILFFARLTEGLHAPALVGEFALETAMLRLLDRSGLSFRAVNAQTFQVERAPRERGKAVAMPVTSARLSTVSDSKLPEVRVIGTAEQLVATRVQTPLQDIPQSISIISPEQIREQNDTDLSEALSHATGVVVRRASSLNEQYYIRSFKVLTIHIDGGAALDASIPEPFVLPSSPDLSEFDHVEVLRGSDALFAGNSYPGGTVSLVRKRPLPTLQMNLSGIVGSWETRRLEADITGPLAADGALRGRADVVYERKNYFYSNAEFERKKIFGVLEYDLAPRATVTAGGSYQWDDAVPWEGGVPFFENGQDIRLPRDSGLTFDWAYQRTRTTEAYLQYRQQFADRWNVRLNVAWWRPQIDFSYPVMLSLGTSPDEQRTGTANAIFSGSPSVHHHQTADLTVTGVLDWFGVREEIALGADYRHGGGRWNDYYVVAGPPQSLRNFDPGLYPDPRNRIADGIQSNGRGTFTQHGAFASMRVHLSDAWSVTTGARIATNENRNVQWTVFRSITFDPYINEWDSHDVVTPYLGLMYRFNDRYSWYASYADIYYSHLPAERFSGGFIGAAHGVNIETGLKGAWRDGALHGSLVLYRTLQRDMAMADLEHWFDDLPDRPFCCHLAADVRSRGAELEITGEAARGWLVGAGYIYASNWAQSAYQTPQVTPRHQARIWTSIQLPGDYSRWTLGGSLTAESHTSVDDGGFVCTFDCEVSAVQKSYAVFDLRAAFQVDRNWQVALNVNNVLDKTYYDSLDPYYVRAFYGPPRNLMFRIDGSF